MKENNTKATKMTAFYLILLCALFALANPLSRQLSGRIIGGINARAGQFPYIAAIYLTRENGRYFCGGTLISNTWVLTAGQCVHEATLFTIHVGSNAPTGDQETSLTLATEHYVLHPEFDPLTLANDIGLIKFREPIFFNDYISQIYFLGHADIPEYSTVVAMGWGRTSDDTTGPVDQLKYVYLSAISNEECKTTYGSQITDSMVCAAGNYNQGTCTGDSGSPLIQQSVGIADYHVGISSFFSGNGCESTDPSGFTRTHVYINWINNVTTNN